MTNWADFLLLLTNKLVKPICVSIFVLTFHRILSSSHSQSPGSRKPWFMFSVWLIAVLPVFLPPPPRFISLPPAFPILLFPVFLSFSWEYAFNVVFPSFSIFFFCLCARGLISLPHPVSFSFFQIRSRWELVLESYVLLASLYGSCDFFFWTSANGWLFFAFVVTYLLPNCYLSWSCSAALHAGIACESKLTVAAPDSIGWRMVSYASLLNAFFVCCRVTNG